jgi:hypothetical protein
MVQKVKCNLHKRYPNLRKYCSDALQLNSKNSFLFCTKAVVICDMCYIAEVMKCTSYSCGFSLYRWRLQFLSRIRILIQTHFSFAHVTFLGCVQVSFMAGICFMPTKYLTISCSLKNHAVSFFSWLLLTLSTDKHQMQFCESTHCMCKSVHTMIFLNLKICVRSMLNRRNMQTLVWLNCM